MILEELKDISHELKKSIPHVADWDVVNTDGAKIGDVDDALFDPASRKIRYLIVDLEVNQLMLENPYQVLIPIGFAKLDVSNSQAIISNISEHQLNQLPKYIKGALTRYAELYIRNILEEGTVLQTPDEWKAFYDHGHFF